MRYFIRGLLLLLAAVPFAHADKLALQKAVQLALGQSTTTAVATADEMRAHSGYREARDAYIPQLVVGSGLAKSWGFPMSIEGSAPSVFELNMQGYLFNMAQRHFVRAARTEWRASSLNAQDQRNQVALETAVTYLQLQRNEEKTAVLRQLSDDAARTEQITNERSQQGINSKLDVKRAALTAARIRLRLADAVSSSDILRQRLSQLTGLPAAQIETDPASVPTFPEFNVEETAQARAIENSSAVKASEARAQSKEERARGEHKQTMPAVDLVGTYGVFSKYNNYDLYFQRFQRNNATLGVQIRFPFLNYAQRAHAEAADAEALRAKKEAQAAREQVATQTLQLQHAVSQLAAARDVAQLEYELAQSDVETAQARTQTGQATILDEQNARLSVGDKHASLIDAVFSLEKARLQLLSLTGDLSKWVGQ